MTPAVIIKPKNVKDIQLVVKYASETCKGVAVRTGGHQYTGASSTSGDNLQLDLSDTFESVVRDFCYDYGNGLLRVGISFSLLQLNSLLRNMKMFIPHGQCGSVHVGGHAQTGGYGMLSRSFGMMCDHIEAFEIVLANGDVKKIWKPNSLYGPNQDVENYNYNDDLFWAVMGGSPGNYGILTHLEIRPLHDKAYPSSHGMKATTYYTKEKLEKCVQVMAEMSDNQELPGNFDYCITVMTDAKNSFYFKQYMQNENELTLDEKMLLHYPEQYADGIPWAEESKLAIPQRLAPVILIYFQWANINGEDECFGEQERMWFEKIRIAMEPLVFDAPKNQSNGRPKLEEMKLFIQAFAASLQGDMEIKAKYDQLDLLRYSDPTAMSELSRYWVYDDVREYCQPFEKRVYMTNKTDLSTNGWVGWVSNQVDQIDGEYRNSDSVNLTVQIQLYGGKNSKLHQIGFNHPQNSSHSWRTDTTIVQVLDGFYDQRDAEALPKLLEWQARNDEEAMEDGIFCEKDRRFLWGSYHRADDEEGGASLDCVWDKYFDSKEKYDRLVDIKRKVDPQYIFTANMFGVDASNAPASKKISIQK